MKKFVYLASVCTLLLSCQAVTSMWTPPTSTPFPTETQLPDPRPIASETPVLTPTASPSPESPSTGSASSSKLAGHINPLTGLTVNSPALLERRPLLVKVSNLPRNIRPQWGLSLADHVYEYYTEEGTTRFAAVFYGQDADIVGPIRSARFFDDQLVSMYKANFAFGSADYRVRDRLFKQPYADRLVIESACPPMCRYEPNGANALVTNTADLSNYITKKKVKGGNGSQNLDGLAFDGQPPAGGNPVNRVYVRYSSAIYNRWDYDQASQKYLRFSDKDDDLQNGQNESYVPLIDRATNQQISTDNLLLLYTKHEYFSRTPEIVDISLADSGKAVLFRNGQVFQLTWKRAARDTLFTLVDVAGQVLALKPGNTFIEVVGLSTTLAQNGAEWRFTFQIP